MMTGKPTFILGECHRFLDERYRLSIPNEMVQGLGNAGELLLVKERPGALSVWNAEQWKPRWNQDLALIESKMQAGRLAGRMADVQLWGRLLSTRQRTIRLAQRGRLVIPEGFREFLGVDPGGSLMVVGAALCVEIWSPESWREHLATEIPKFRELEGNLSI
jgi:MraZ protein